jgi:hypothetical protein
MKAALTDRRRFPMAGFVGEARQWRKFEKRAAKVLRHYGVDICHAIDLKRGDNAFEGWSVDKKIEFVDGMQHVVNETLGFGYAVILRTADYDKFYAPLDRPKKVVRDTKYGILFRATLAGMIEGIGMTLDWKQRVSGLQLVLESGHPNSGDAMRLFEFARAHLSERARKVLVGLSFKPKDSCLPLAAADLLAYAAYQVETGGKRIGTPKKPMKSNASYQGNCYRHVIKPSALEALYRQSLALHGEKQEFGQRTKRALSALAERSS